MSWSDPCSYCGAHRADCDCGHWGETEIEVKKKEQKKKSWIENVMRIQGFTRELAEENYKKIYGSK